MVSALYDKKKSIISLIAMPMLLLLATRPITLPCQCGFCGEDKNKSKYVNPHCILLCAVKSQLPHSASGSDAGQQFYIPCEIIIPWMATKARWLPHMLKVARLNSGCSWASLIYTMNEVLEGGTAHEGVGGGVRPVNWICRLWCHCP